MLFAVKAYEAKYGGLYGMTEEAICEETDVETVEKIAFEMSQDVIESYSNIYENILYEAREQCDNEDESSEEFEEALAEVISERIAFEIYEIDAKKIPTNDITVLEKMLSNIGFEKFCKQYCFPNEVC